jgi:HK97 family phage portal protein
MNRFLSFFRWFAGGNALADRAGQQDASPSSAIVSDASSVGPDVALQIATVWACVSRRATTVASLPFFAYESVGGRRALARDSRLWTLLHESPNSRMTPYEFWVAMLLNHDLRGNAYARIDRDPRTGEALALWPMHADQIEVSVLADGSMAYAYRVDNDLAILSQDNVLHLKDLGNGTVGLPRLDYMRATASEAKSAQAQSHRLFSTSGKPTGVLMVDQVLTKEQRAKIQERFGEMSAGNMSRLYVLEANMKYQQLSLSPEDQQLLESRRFEVEEICRWFDVPPVIVHHSNVSTWGSGIEQIVDGFHKFTVRPLLVSIEQAVRKRVMTPAQRASMSVEFSLDALLRASLKDRMEIYSKAVQNGIYSRNECRQLENAEPYAGGDIFTAQVNLAPVEMLGQVAGSNTSGADGSAPIAQ